MIDMSGPDVVNRGGNDGGMGLTQQDFLSANHAEHSNMMSPDFKRAVDANKRIEERERLQALRDRRGGMLGDSNADSSSHVVETHTMNMPFAQAEQALRDLELATHDSVTERLLSTGFGCDLSEDTFITRSARARKAATSAKLNRRTVAQRARDATYAHYMRTKARDRWHAAQTTPGDEIAADEYLEGATGKLVPPPMSDEHNYGRDFDWTHDNKDLGSGSDDESHISTHFS